LSWVPQCSTPVDTMGEEQGLNAFRPNEDNDASESNQRVAREHSWPKCIYITSGLSLCITVDILQYSMPLAFLPSVLEDRGHEPLTIATAVGVYYWTGLAGGAMITSYQIMRLLRSDGRDAEEATTVGTVRKQLVYLIIGLGVGSVTLICQAMHPHYWMHTCCRFLQGFAGSFIFFYSFLLSANLFKDKQKTFAMTMTSMALNIAEVLGSSIGAYVFDRYGQETVFALMGVLSILNQLLLFVMLSSIVGDGTVQKKIVETGFQITEHGWRRFKEVLKSERLYCAVILIFMAAVVKASVEEVLPFHADHRWQLTPLEIGNLFSIIAFAYIGSALLSGHVWHQLKSRRMLFSAFWLSILGVVAWSVFLVSSLYHHKVALWAGLFGYGVCLGVTHTPAALLLGEAIEHEEGRAKDAVNGIWNTMWEAGGSLGFLLGGLLAEDYNKQLRLFGFYTILCAICGVTMLMMGGLRDERLAKPQKAMLQGYGSTTV